MRMNMRSRILTREEGKREPVLWIIDSEQWPRACLRAELIERGYNPYGFISINDALDSLSRRMSPRPEALVLELRGQDLTPQVMETIRDLPIPAILLGGSAELNDPLVRAGHWYTVLKRPFWLGTIAHLVESVVPQSETKPRD